MPARTRRAVSGMALVGAAALAALIAPTAAAAVPSGDTTVVFTVEAGALSITVPTTAVLGTALSGQSLSGQLGAVTVTDARGLLTASWIASVATTEFTTGGGTPAETVGTDNAQYWSGPATATTGVGVFTPKHATAADAGGMPDSAFSLSNGVGNNSATWNPTVVINVPFAAVAGTYSGTITHSVA